MAAHYSVGDGEATADQTTPKRDPAKVQCRAQILPANLRSGKDTARRMTSFATSTEGNEACRSRYAPRETIGADAQPRPEPARCCMRRSKTKRSHRLASPTISWSNSRSGSARVGQSRLVTSSPRLSICIQTFRIQFAHPRRGRRADCPARTACSRIVHRGQRVRASISAVTWPPQAVATARTPTICPAPPAIYSAVEWTPDRCRR